MKKTFFITGFLLGAFNLVSLISQAQQQCPQIQFSYDEAGNRKQRKMGSVLCKWNPNTSTNDIETNLIANIYPNPAQDKINIELQKDESEHESTIFLYDMIGKEIYSTKTSLLLIEVDVSQLNSGNYLLKVVRGKNFSTYNVSKN